MSTAPASPMSPINLASPSSSRTGTRSSPSSASARDHRAASRETSEELKALEKKPWRGMATSLKSVQKKILSHFEERPVKKRKFGETGEQVDFLTTKYWVKWDGEDSAKETTRLNITRLFEELLRSKGCPLDVKLDLCKEVNNKAAKDFVAKQQLQTTVPKEVKAQEDELQAKRQAMKTQGDAHARDQKRQTQINEYMTMDAPLPKPQYELGLFLLSVALLMCYLPFAIVNNFYFRRFLAAIRPKFEAQLGGDWLRRKMAGPLLDEVYEEAVEVAQEALDRRPGLLTLGIDGHKDGRSRTLETITLAKLGISTFLDCEYMRTTRATAKNLAALVKKNMLRAGGYDQIIAVVADNTSTNLRMFEELKKVIDSPCIRTQLASLSRSQTILAHTHRWRGCNICFSWAASSTCSICWWRTWRRLRCSQM